MLERTMTSSETLESLALALYWAEGSKSLKAHVVDLANSDPDILKLFLRFLREVVGIDEMKLRVYVYTHADRNLDLILNYWSDKLDIPRKQFTKPYIQKVSGTNHREMPYGLAHVRYANKKLLLRILTDIEKLKAWAGGGVVKRT